MDDDVRAVAAASLVPVVESLVHLQPEKVSRNANISVLIGFALEKDPGVLYLISCMFHCSAHILGTFYS